MAKKIKFPLEMRDGFQARTLDELKQYFDIEKVMESLVDSRLETWLRDRYYISEADRVAGLDLSSHNIRQELCSIFGVESVEDSGVDVGEIQLRKERLMKLKQHTDDEEIWKQVDNVAFDQEELADLLDDGCSTIYLCGDRFQIPYAVGDKEYTGIGSPEVLINAPGKIDLRSQNITLKNVTVLNDNIETVDIIESDDDVFRLAQSYLWARNGKEYDFDKALELFHEAAENGHADAMAYFVYYVFIGGKRIAYDYELRNELQNEWQDEWDRLSESEFIFCPANKYADRYGLSLPRAREMLEKSISLGSSYGLAVKARCLYYYDKMGYEHDEKEAYKLAFQALDMGEPYAVEVCCHVWDANDKALTFHLGEPGRDMKQFLKKSLKLKSAYAALWLVRMHLERHSDPDSPREMCRKADDISNDELCEYLKQAAELEVNGYPYTGEGLVLYADALCEGAYGMERNIEEAVIYYKKALNEFYGYCPTFDDSFAEGWFTAVYHLASTYYYDCRTTDSRELAYRYAKMGADRRDDLGEYGKVCGCMRLLGHIKCEMGDSKNLSEGFDYIARSYGEGGYTDGSSYLKYREPCAHELIMEKYGKKIKPNCAVYGTDGVYCINGDHRVVWYSIESLYGYGMSSSDIGGFDSFDACAEYSMVYSDGNIFIGRYSYGDTTLFKLDIDTKQIKKVDMYQNVHLGYLYREGNSICIRGKNGYYGRYEF